MVLLYGIRFEYHQDIIGGEFNRVEVRDLIATFDTWELAQDYINKSKLKNPVRTTCFQEPKVFRKKSLLGAYDTAEIVDKEYFQEPEHNPKV